MMYKYFVCTTDQILQGTGTFVRREQHIQDMFSLTHQLRIIYGKMDKQSGEHKRSVRVARGAGV